MPKYRAKSMTNQGRTQGGSRGALEPPFLRHKINIVPRIDFYTCQLTHFTFDSLKTTLLTSVKASLVKRSLRDACLTELTE